ncbi:aminoacyl-tRNA synthetase [Fragilaria crotonensis]|nr:aminoacyl-tRNA synthetase [Fragilaria crotonensis]
MYDFSHPIADAVEGITHSLCTLEFEDHRPFYDWTVEKLRAAGMLHSKPQQIEFSRLNIKTLSSKRKLIQLVEEILLMDGMILECRPFRVFDDVAFLRSGGPEGQLNDGQVPRGWKRLIEGDTVRLKFAYVIRCDEVIRDPLTQEPVDLKCTYFPETRAGVTPEGMKKAKGIIHWVDGKTAINCQVNQYDRLFLSEEPGKESGDYLQDLNPNSLEVINNVVVEPSVGKDALSILAKIRNAEGTIYASSLSYQFERSGYFALDKASTDANLIFNRVVTLRDTWAGEETAPANVEQQQRSRGGGNSNGTRQPSPVGAEVVEDLRRPALRAATIVDVGPHPEADSLLLLKVDCGDVGGAMEPRTVVAGLAGKISINDLIGKKVVAVTNLKPAKMRGIESHAMLLAASDGKEENEKVELLVVPDSVPNGELISFDGKEPSEPDEMMKSKGALKVWDRVKAGFQTNSEGEAVYSWEGQTFRMMTSGGPIKAASLQNAGIQ